MEYIYGGGDHKRQTGAAYGCLIEGSKSRGRELSLYTAYAVRSLCDRIAPLQLPLVALCLLPLGARDEEVEEGRRGAQRGVQSRLRDADRKGRRSFQGDFVHLPRRRAHN